MTNTNAYQRVLALFRSIGSCLDWMANNMNEAPVRLCCGERHDGVECKDGLVMCCLCFERFPIDELSMKNGERWDVCMSCAAEEAGRRVIREHGEALDRLADM